CGATSSVCVNRVIHYVHSFSRARITGRLSADLMSDTADLILEAAERCMNRYGIAVSMSDVASEAGLSRGSLYRHFGQRDGLVRAVLARTADRFVAGAAERIDRRRTLSAQFAEAVAVVAASANRLEREG